MLLACRDEQTWTWTTVPHPYELEHADAYLARQAQYDSDLWVLEIQDRDGWNPFAEEAS